MSTEMHVDKFTVTTQFEVVVRQNNDGWCIWYLELHIDGNETDLPADFEHVFGDIDVGADENESLFLQAEQEALKEAARLKAYFLGA